MTRQPTPGVHENFADKQSPGNRAITGETAREWDRHPLPPTSIIELKPGDRFVMRLDCHATREVLERINATWKQFAGEDVKLLILDKGMELTVARETTPEQHQQTGLREAAHQAPVAWRWRWKDSQAWVLSDQEPLGAEFRVIEPLSILTPAPESQVVGDLHLLDEVDDAAADSGEGQYEQDHAHGACNHVGFIDEIKEASFPVRHAAPLSKSLHEAVANGAAELSQSSFGNDAPAPQTKVVASRPGLVPVALGVVAVGDGARPPVVADGVEAVVGLDVVPEHPSEQHCPDDTNDDDGSSDVHEISPAKSIPLNVRNFLGKVQGVCLGVAISGRSHPNPDGALMELAEEAQELLFPVKASAAETPNV